MSKGLAKAAMIIGAVALVATGVGAVAGASLGAAAATVGTVATVATVASAALSVAAAVTAKKPSGSSTGSPTQFSANPDAGLPYVIGRTGNAGDIIFRQGWDTRDKGENDRQAFVAALSVGPIAGVESMTVDRAATSFSGAGAAIGQYAGYMWSTVQLGLLPTAAALGFGSGAGTPPGWTSAHRLNGLAAATWTLRYDARDKPQLYQAGVPAPMWTVKGGFAYDPRKDSTYPGGSGPHRMADPGDTAAYDAAVATWEWTENPYLHALKWIHGLWWRDKTVSGSRWQRVLGMGAPAVGIDMAPYVEGANVADVNGWKVGGVIYSRDGKWETLKKILQAGMGEPLTLGAKVSCFVNAPKVSLANIGVDDVRGEVTVKGTQGRRTRINTITPRYRKEANNWAMLPGSPISVAEYVAEDRGKRSKAQDYAFIQDDSQVGTAVRYDIENGREFGPITVPLQLAWLGYKPGDCVTVTVPEVGLNAQPILLLNRELDPGECIVTFTARSETAAKHPYALGQVATPAPTPGLTGPALVPQPGTDAWSLFATLAPGTAVATPALVITGEIDSATADTVVIEYQVEGATEWTGAGVEAPTITRKEIRGVDPATSYKVSVRYRARGILGERRILGPVTTASREIVGGDSAYNIILTNDGEQLPATHDGTITSYAAATTGVRVFYGGEDVTAQFAPVALTPGDGRNPQGLVLSGSYPDYGVVGGFDANEDNAAFVFRVAGTGAHAGVTLDKQFSLSKSKAALDGTPAPLIHLTADKDYAKYNAADEYVGGAITLKATRENLALPVQFKFIQASDGTVLTSGTADELAAQPAFAGSSGDTVIYAAVHIAFAMATYGTIQVVAYREGTAAIDSVSIGKIKDGAPGDPGEPGEDGFIADTEVPVFAIPCFSSGAAKPSWTGGTGTIKLTKGGSVISTGVTYSLGAQSNMASLTLSGNTFSFAGITADTGYFDIIATFGGENFTRRVSVKKVYDGSAAFRGSAALSVTNNNGVGAAAGSGSTPIPGGSTVTISGTMSYDITNGGSTTRNFTGRLYLYVRNATDSGALTLLGYADGSLATRVNTGSPSDPVMQNTPGTVSASFSFASAATDKVYEFSAQFGSTANTGTATTVSGSGTIKAEVTA